MDSLKYPIGIFKKTDPFTLEQIKHWINQIEELPEKLAETVGSLTEQQLDTPYRNGGWSVRQVIHHIADSHLNGYIRVKWALTEQEPTIRTYNQELWAELPDYKAPVTLSLTLIEALHDRWCRLLKQLGGEDFSIPFRHPETGIQKIGHLVQLYAWHGKHHLAHITFLAEREGWDKAVKKSK